MQNDFMNAYKELINELEKTLNELMATNSYQSEQIKQLTIVNQELNLRTKKYQELINTLNIENSSLTSMNMKQSELLKQLEKRIKP